VPVASGSNDPFDWWIGETFRNTLYEYERGVSPYLSKGHTIQKHWDKPYSYLSGRCIENRRGIFSTWTNKVTAYDRIKRTFRGNEANMANMAVNQHVNGAVFRNFNPTFSKHGRLVRCDLPGPLRYLDYLNSGTQKTRIVVNGLAGVISMVSAFPIYF